MTAERAEERIGNGLADDEQRDADRKRYPERLRGESCRALLLTCAGRTDDNGCRAVGQEVEGFVNGPESTVPASPSGAICGRPRWPTVAVSART